MFLVLKIISWGKFKRMKKILLNFLVFTLVFSVYGQTISGTVINSEGSPLENALVCLTNHPSVFVKTDENGSFTINGAVGTRLRVGALRYDTVKSFVTTSANNQNIVMQKDPLLDTDVFHVSFDHIRQGDKYSNAELKDDFGLSYSKGFYHPRQEQDALDRRGFPLDSDRASIDYTESRDENGTSLKVRFPAGGIKTDDSGVDTRIDLEGVFNNNTYQSEDLYLSYWVKFSDNFRFDLCGGKLPSLGGSTFNSANDRWKGRIMWRKGGSIQFYMELPDNRFNPENDARFWGEQETEGSGICDFTYTSYLATPGWHNIELHYKFETPGQNDGLFEGWVDGANFNVMDATVFNNYRPSGTERENITINSLLISAFLGGSDIEDYTPTEDTFAWFDEFRVSTERIDEWNDYISTTLSNNQFNTKKPVLAYPNPSKNGFFQLSESKEWTVFNALGQKMAKGKGTNVNLTKASKGLYFLNIENTSLKLIVE